MSTFQCGDFIEKDETYVDLLIKEGATIPIDVGDSFEMKIPEWADEKKIKKGQLFFLQNIDSMTRGIWCGIICTSAIPSILNVLQFTKQSSTAETAYKRYLKNILYVKPWMMYDLKPETRAWKSLQFVRKLHLSVSNRSTKNGSGMISQKDVAITQIAFVGLPLLCHEKLGVQGPVEQFDAFCHLWRVLGYMLGLEDRFNLCGETLSETLSKIEAIRTHIYVPALSNPSGDFYNYYETMTEGIWTFSPDFHPKALMFFIKRIIGVPEYYYFDSEKSSGDISNSESLSKLSLYQRYRLFNLIMRHQYFTKFFVSRWYLNVKKLTVTGFLEVCPIIAIFKFGWNNAFVSATV